MEWDPHSLHCTFGFTIPAGIVQNLAYHCPKINTLSQEKISCVLHQKSTVLWRFWSRKSFQLVLSTKRHMLHEFKPKRLRFWIWSADTIVNMHLCPRWCIIFTPPFVSWRRICTQGKIRCTEVQMIASVKRLEVTWDCMSLKRSAMMRLKEKLTSFAFARHCFSNLLISNMSHGYIIQRLEYFAENLSPHVNPKLTKFQAAEIGNSANLFRENRKSSGCFGSHIREALSGPCGRKS